MVYFQNSEKTSALLLKMLLSKKDLLLIFDKYFFHLISLAFTPHSNSVKLCEFLR